MSSLERAIVIAATAHAGQRDKAGAPYILHPLRVMGRLAGDDERIVAVLHDVVEDSAWTLDALRAEGFSAAVLCGVDALTRRDGEEYEAFVRRAAEDPIGRLVKRADLLDNLDSTRLAGEPSERDRARIAKYRAALAVLDALDAEGPAGRDDVAAAPGRQEDGR